MAAAAMAAKETSPEVQEFQRKMDALIETYVNEHSEESVKQLREEVDDMFARAKPVDAVSLYKHLPAELSRPHTVRVLELELEKVPNANISVLVKESLKNMEFQSEDEKRKIMHLVHECLRRSANEEDQEGSDVLIKFLSTFSGDENTWNGIPLAPLAARAALNHFKYGMLPTDPVTWQFDTICGLRPVRNLSISKEKEHRLLHQLLYSIFAAGKCAVFIDFYKANKKLMEEEWKLNFESLMSKVRLLGLCTACSDKQQVTYDTVAEALCIEGDEVEMYVIEAMSLSLLNAKIDSMGRVVIIKSVHHPLLDRTHWNLLQGNLLNWYESVSTLVNTLDAVRVQQVKEDREQDRIEAPGGRR